jgi:glucose/arabinose dehydrogenase
VIALARRIVETSPISESRRRARGSSLLKDSRAAAIVLKPELMIFSTARRPTGHGSAFGSLVAAIALTTFLAAPIGAATYSVAGFSDYAVVTGLVAPTDFAFLPDGRMLILEKAGRVLIAGPGGGAPTVALDMIASVDDGNEKGLLGVCLHPSFASTGWIYLYYTANGPKNRVSRFTLVGNTISPASELIPIVLDNIEATNGNHNGGTVLIGPDGKLWAAPGDSGTGGAKAQDLSATSSSRFNGKVLRMELDGSPAAGNPFLGDATKEPRIWEYGHRNPFRFSFRPSNGSLYIGDVGQSTLEELDVGVAGGNFGWPYMEGSIVQPGGPGPCPMTTTCIPPVFDYARTVGTTIIGGAFVTGNAYPASLEGRYVFGDNGSSWIKYLEFDSNDALVGGLHDLATAAEGPVAFHQGPDGYLYYVAISTGRIYRIVYGTQLTTLDPCRVLDTRLPVGQGGPALAAGTDRVFVIGGRCGIPAGARAVAANLTATLATVAGNLIVFPQGGPPPTTSVLNFGAGQTRANNAVLTLGPGGDVVVRCSMPAGEVHLILDVSGWFQ